jgi:hypothetical protein
MSSPFKCATLTSMFITGQEKEVKHTITVTPDKENRTKLGSVGLKIPSISLHLPDGIHVDWKDLDISLEYANVSIFDGVDLSHTFYLNTPPPIFTFTCTAGEFITSSNAIPATFVSLQLTKMECKPITITDNNGKVLLDLSNTIERELCSLVNKTKPAFEKKKDSDVIYAMIELGTVKERFEVVTTHSGGKRFGGHFDIKLEFLLDLCLSPTGMGLYLKINFTIDGYSNKFPFTGLNRFVADINDVIKDYDHFIKDCWVCSDSWEIGTLPTDDSIMIPALGPVSVSGGMYQLLSFTPLP